MTQLLLFVLLGCVLLAAIGQTATPRWQRLPLRRWTPVHVADLVGRGVRVFSDAGKERLRRQDLAREEVEGRRGDERPEGPPPPPPPGAEDPPPER
ncbi:hypothetical protein AVL62_09795 [Serinicoccus chungangensis]|uniref:Uncharacterized protein n=1 Tax=Serinicoccus chungangensis TaxID=767452 RepID=A0A0W8I1I9_9MICO|nr:hypothetical protein [Serinicoccus chungangensis]KUG51600.1 hypothetical protein AVL62_09795 [Serinicoccus chungangensis]